MAKINSYGIIFDTKTGKISNEDGSPLHFGGDFTFDYIEGANFLQFATQATGDKLVNLLEKEFPGITFKTKYSDPWTAFAPKQLLIEASRYGISTELNAGLVANSLIRSLSFNGIRAELKTAGLLF